jgi:hypothetical protein
MTNLDTSRRPMKPQNDVVMSLRRALNEVYDFLTPEHGAPVLAKHFGVNRPEQVEATGLIEAIDKLHNRADELIAEQEAAADAEAKAMAEAEAAASEPKPTEGGDPAEVQGSGGMAQGNATPPAVEDKQNDAGNQ